MTRSGSRISRQAYSYRDDPAVPDFADDRPIIIFDGYCALCSGWAAFVLKHDTERRYRLVIAQSDLGRALYVHYGLDPDDYETARRRFEELSAGGGQAAPN